MEKMYLIFVDRYDVYSYISFFVKPEDLVSHLIEEEMMDEGDKLENLSWVIFEDGKMIQG